MWVIIKRELSVGFITFTCLTRAIYECWILLRKWMDFVHVLFVCIFSILLEKSKNIIGEVKA